MDEDRISERSWDALAERSLPAYMQETSSSGRFTSRRRMLSRNRKSLTVRYGDDDAVDVDDDDSDDDDEIQRAQPVPSSTTPIFIPVPATATVTITAAAAAATPERDCYLKDQASTTSQDADACKKYHSSPSNDHYQSSALQTGAEKAGLVVGLTVGLSMIVCLIVFLTLRRKYRPGFTLWSCLTRRKRSSEFDDRKWAPLGDGGDGAVWPDKSKARPVTMTVQELDAGLVETVARKPSLRERDSESNTVTASEKATENTTRPAQARLTIETRSSGSWRTENEKELLDLMRESESESDPPPTAKTRRPWMSYFSWSTAPTTPACSSNRETMMTDDSEPPRFRSISSWVNYQSERQQRQRQRQTSGVVLLPPPIVERRILTNPNPKPNYIHNKSHHQPQLKILNPLYVHTYYSVPKYSKDCPLYWYSKVTTDYYGEKERESSPVLVGRQAAKYSVRTNKGFVTYLRPIYLSRYLSERAQQQHGLNTYAYLKSVLHVLASSDLVQGTTKLGSQSLEVAKSEVMVQCLSFELYSIVDSMPYRVNGQRRRIPRNGCENRLPQMAYFGPKRAILRNATRLAAVDNECCRASNYRVPLCKPQVESHLVLGVHRMDFESATPSLLD
ncbi:hypothetical protein T310_7261 [Rasamsonia emersonii CBS 393.64]|uniref:Uncharacterized protein n=1 Tax=Rasamsonia emersonii (strain ATCC 16479 / CBS 393.64 / IMI 116815) TaxID=1408163 RepID=A0A0F4YKP0_RASE3|nr:hypothetical protein T310_7261 [Rasamsonia emersonii CBS 393.64]KKA18794.1 hypothetical protein T310_7261 [Rasamsonia emersonii CBS 393.64]